jgi:hypothetical protein
MGPIFNKLLQPVSLKGKKGKHAKTFKTNKQRIKH